LAPVIFYILDEDIVHARGNTRKNMNKARVGEPVRRSFNKFFVFTKRVSSKVES